MLKKNTRLQALILCLMLAIAVAAGPAPLYARASENDGEATVTYPISLPGEKKLTMWVPMHPVSTKYISNYSDHMVFQEISKNTGIEMTYLHPAAGQESEQLSVLVASGDLPDILQIRGFYNGGSGAGVTEGIFVDLTDYIPVHAPDYLKAISTSDLAYRLATNNDGTITNFHIVKSDAPPYNRLNYIQDVMDELGLDVPVTIADYEEDFAKMKEAGMYAFSPATNGRNDLLMWPYGITNGFFIGEDGTVKWGLYEPAYLDYLTMMNDWYNKGYLSPDFMSNLTDMDRRGQFSTKTVGMFIGSLDVARTTALSVDLTSAPLPYPRLYEGQVIHFDPVSYETLPLPNENFSTVVSTSCEVPEIAVQYLNYYFSQEGADLCNWGIKDLTYVVDEDGKKSYTDYVLNNEDIPFADASSILKIHQGAKLSEPDVVCNPGIMSSEIGLEFRLRYSDDPNVDAAQRLPAFTLGLEENDRRNEIMRDINTYVDEMTLKFITNVTPLSDFENYRAQLKSMGIEDAIALTDEGYQLFLTKPGLNE